MKAVDLPGRSARGVLVVFMAFFCARRPLCGLRAVGGGRGSGGSGKPGESAFPPRAPALTGRRTAACEERGRRVSRPSLWMRGRRGGVPRAFRLPADGPNGSRAAGRPYFNFNGGAAAGEVLMELQSFFAQNPKVALGFSGGVDSSYLLCAGGWPPGWARR